MIYCPKKYDRIPTIASLNEFYDLKGELDDKVAKITLAKFLRTNLGFTSQLLANVNLYPEQEIALKGLFNRNFSMLTWARSGSKSWLAAYYAVLRCVFVPETHVMIIAPTFRGARNMMSYAEKIVYGKGAELLRDCFPKEISKRTDIYEWTLGNGSSIRAVPLNGEKIRGFRCQVLILDEFLLFSEDIVTKVLMPFLLSPQNLKERIEVRAAEDEAIKRGEMREEEREVFTNTAQLICLSSASYTFEYLYRLYNNWSEKIYASSTEESEKMKMEGIDERHKPTYFISQMGWEAFPPDMLDASIIAEAKSGGNDPSFLREYCAQFVDGSDSYFSMKRMNECSIPEGESPAVEIIGEKGADYILAIDPNSSDSESSDYFAMALLKMNHETKIPMLIHGYGETGSIKKHHAYFLYLLQNFNIRQIVIDNAGGEFIAGANQSAIFQKADISLKEFTFNSDLEGQEYIDECRRVRDEYNPGCRQIFYKQFFSSSYIRKANEYLKACIDYKKVTFASSLRSNGAELEKAVGLFETEYLDIKKIRGIEALDMGTNTDVSDFIDDVSIIPYQTKKQCAIIEIQTTNQGVLRYDLPSNLKKGGKQRARKDNYTALFMGVWANKCYYDIMKAEEVEYSFDPIILR